MKSALKVVVIGLAFATFCTGQTLNIDPQTVPKNADLRIRVSRGVIEGLAVKKVYPHVPWSKEKGHEKGSATLSLLIDYDGKVKTIFGISGDPVLAELAAAALRQWEFKPFEVDGRPMQVESRVKMTFKKDRASLENPN